MPEIDELVQAPFPLPDPELRRTNLWITQDGRDFNITPTRLGYIFQGRRPPRDPFENQLWWDTSSSPATLKAWQGVPPRSRWVTLFPGPLPTPSSYRESAVTNFTLVPFTSSGVFTVTSLTLEAGDWDIWGFIEFQFPTGRTGRLIQGQITALPPPNPPAERPFSFLEVDFIPDTVPPSAMDTFGMTLPFHRRLLTADQTVIYEMGLARDDSHSVNGIMYKGFLAARWYGETSNADS